MAIAATSAASAAGALGTGSENVASRKPTLGYDDFLKLLISQMQNQDPLKPMDSTEYVSQLATFSSVEQGVKLNAKLDQLLITSNISQGENVVGKFVTSADGSISGKVTSVRVDDAAITAILDNGKVLTLGSGITISQA
jgi:flagellar basal-body rod modification protein FlgD